MEPENVARAMNVLYECEKEGHVVAADSLGNHEASAGTSVCWACAVKAIHVAAEEPK